MSMQGPEQELLNKINPHCFRKPGYSLVYIATLKCASTYYSTLLLDNGWERIYFTDIDWQRDQVFSFINDPDLRYHKGLSEDVLNAESEELESHILQTLSKFDQHLGLFSFHTLPITIKLQGYIDKIFWIPIFDGSPHHEIFLELLKSYNLTAEPGENLDPNMANEKKKTYYNKIQSATNLDRDLYKIFTAGNKDLFKKVCSKLNSNNSSWQEISCSTIKNSV